MKALGQYDSTLQMFRDQPCDVNMSRLRFLRWLGEHDLLEHAIAGSSSGAYSVTVEPFAETAGEHASELFAAPQSQITSR